MNKVRKIYQCFICSRFSWWLVVCVTLTLVSACSKKNKQSQPIPSPSDLPAERGSSVTLQAPTDLSLILTTPTSLSFSFVNSEENAQIDIERCNGAECDDFQAVFGSPFDPGKLQHEELGLSTNSIYIFRIRVVDGIFSSRWVTSEPWSTAESAAAPSQLRASLSGSTSVTLEWADNSSFETKYDIEYCSGSNCSSFSSAAGSPIAADSTRYTVAGLTANSTYSFRIRAASNSGASDWVTLSNVATGPLAPTGLTASTITSTSITLSWVDNANNETAYQVERCLGSSCTSFATVSGSPLAANSQTISVSGLSNQSTYNLRVRAINSTSSSDWVTLSVTTKAALASCTTAKTVTLDRGLKSASAVTGRGLWSSIELIPGTTRQAIAYHDGSATGGAASIKLSWWNGSGWQIESVAGDNRVAAGSAVYVNLGFFSTGIPLVAWANGSTTIRAAVRSAPLGTAGSWTYATIDTVTGAANRALDLSINEVDQVALAYLTNTTTAGRARFIYCETNCTVFSNYFAMSAESDTIEAANITAAMQSVGVGWCKKGTGDYRPAVTYPGNGGSNIRYASCNGSLSSCRTAIGWSGQLTNVVASAGTVTKMLLRNTIVGDTPKIITRNAGNTLLQVFQMNQGCDASPLYTFSAGATFGAATSGTSWAQLLVDANGFYHVIANLGTTAVHHHNSLTTNLISTTWNAAGVVDTTTLSAAGSGAGDAAMDSTNQQIYTSYGSAAAPFNINMGVVSDTNIASNSASATYSSVIPDLTGSVALSATSGQVRSNGATSTNDNRPAVIYIDHSAGSVAGGILRYAVRNGNTAESTWTKVTIPNVSSPRSPSIAFDHLDRPWISYFDGGSFRYYLVTNTATDGSGDWSFYQFPLNTKTAVATAPATDDTAMAMWYSNNIAKPVIIVGNSTAAGGAGIKASMFDPTLATFSTVQTLDALGGSFATRLVADFDRNGNIVVGYYDITATRTEFSYSSNGITWLGTSAQISTANTGREGLSISINPATSRPAMSYLDRANNTLYYAYCTKVMSLCSVGSNWQIQTVATGLGISGIAIANEQLLSTSLNFDADGNAYIAYMTGIGAPTQVLNLTTNSSGSFVPANLRTRAAANISGAAAVNFDTAGFDLANVILDDGTSANFYIGPGNYLQVTTCGD